MPLRSETFVTFGLDNATFALSVAAVVEILDVQEITPLPRMPDHMLGLIDRRGSSVPVTDLRLLFRAPPREDCDDTRILVLQSPLGPTKATIGLRVDNVIEVTQLEADEDAAYNGSDIPGWSEPMVAGIARRHGDFVAIIDIKGLFEEIPRRALLPFSAQGGS